MYSLVCPVLGGVCSYVCVCVCVCVFVCVCVLPRSVLASRVGGVCVLVVVCCFASPHHVHHTHSGSITASALTQRRDE